MKKIEKIAFGINQKGQYILDEDTDKGKYTLDEKFAQLIYKINEIVEHLDQPVKISNCPKTLSGEHKFELCSKEGFRVLQHYQFESFWVCRWCEMVDDLPKE